MKTTLHQAKIDLINIDANDIKNKIIQKLLEDEDTKQLYLYYMQKILDNINNGNFDEISSIWEETYDSYDTKANVIKILKLKGFVITTSGAVCLNTDCYSTSY